MKKEDRCFWCMGKSGVKHFTLTMKGAHVSLEFWACEVCLEQQMDPEMKLVDEEKGIFELFTKA